MSFRLLQPACLPARFCCHFATCLGYAIITYEIKLRHVTVKLDFWVYTLAIIKCLDFSEEQSGFICVVAELF